MKNVSFNGDALGILKRREDWCKMEYMAYRRWFNFLDKLQKVMFALFIGLCGLILMLVYSNLDHLKKVEIMLIPTISVLGITLFTLYLQNVIRRNQKECKRMIDEYIGLEKEYAATQTTNNNNLDKKITELDEQLSITRFWDNVVLPVWLINNRFINVK